MFSQPSEFPEMSPDEYSYIGSSYVKYLESAGAQVVPINYTWDEDTLKAIFVHLNGVMAPGGNASYIVDGEFNPDGSPVYTPFG